MSSVRREIYPSSNVSDEAKRRFGWIILGEVPSELKNGRLAPTNEASEYFRMLRTRLEEARYLRIITGAGIVAIQDFATTITETESPTLLLHGLKSTEDLPSENA